MQEEIVIESLEYIDAFTHERKQGFLLIDLYRLKLVSTEQFIEKAGYDDHFVEVEDDEFLLYVINTKRNISKEK